MPPIGLALGGVYFTDIFVLLKDGEKAAGPYATLDAAREAGAVTTNLGVFMNSVISFMIVSFAVFLLVKGINAAKRKEEVKPPDPTTKDCPECFSAIPIKAKRCPQCTSALAV